TNPAPTAISTLSLHDALPISLGRGDRDAETGEGSRAGGDGDLVDRRERDARSREQTLDGREQLVGVTALRMPCLLGQDIATVVRSEEHTSELQSRGHLVCRLL